MHPTSESYSFIKILGSGAMKSGAPEYGRTFIVDIRDVTTAHVAAGFSEEADGRYIVMGHNTNMLAFAKVIGEKFPDYPLPKSTVPRFILCLILAPYIGMTRHQVWRNGGHTAGMDNSKSKKDLKIEDHPKETFPDMFAHMLEGGLIPSVGAAEAK